MTAAPRSRPVTSRPAPARALGAADPDRKLARVLSVIAMASIAAGALNAAAASTLGSSSNQNLVFFAVVAAAQLGWGFVALVWAPRWWLALGAVGNLIVVATWVVSRTAGLPFGVYDGVRLPARFPDTLATVLEVVIVAGAAALAARGRGPARSVTRALGVTVGAAVVAGALAIGGIAVQAGTTGASSTGHGPGVTHPAGPGVGGGGHSGGGAGSTSGGSGSGGGGYGY
jgi:hypothetical protein